MSSTAESNQQLATADFIRKSATQELLGQFANLPTAFKSPGKELASKEDYLAKLETLKQYPSKQLQDAGQLLALFNRYNLKADKRLQLSMAIVAQLYPVIARFYQQYQTQPSSLPEGKDRKQIVMASIEIAEQAILSCKHLFVELYSAKPALYRKQRPRLLELAVRILELARVVQRLRALRHQKLSAHNWRDINRVFFALLAQNDVDEKITLLGQVGTWLNRTDKEGFKVSPRHLYLSLQLFGIVDASSWSTRLFHVPDGYLDLVDNAILLHVDNSLELQAGMLITGIDHAAPAQFRRDVRMVAPRILIEYSQLYNRLVQDYEELAKMKFIGNVDVSRLNRALAGIDAMERLPLLEAMLFGLRPRERRQKRHAAFGSENLRLYFSFKDAFRLFANLGSAEMKQRVNSREFIHTLASPALGANDAVCSGQTPWEIANFSTGGVLVITRESDYSAPICVGQITAFSSGKDQQRPLLGYVSRIHRPSDQLIEVAIVRLSGQAEAALVTPESGKLVGKTLGVMLFKNVDDRWCVVTRYEYDFVLGTPLRLLRDKAPTLPARLGNVLLTKQEFVIFELSVPGM
ncbi:MAG: hypothetical protein HY080_01075 [Gammaproteobacteria bacterium]|nr:hypothetical protein [Gammaproteobacteria bacterium]